MSDLKKQVVEVKKLDVDSNCTGRNGTHDICEVYICPSIQGRDMFRIGCVSRKLHRDINGGIVLGAEDMDRLAAGWLKMRNGNATPAGMLASGKTVGQAIKEIEVLARDIREGTEG